MKTLRASIILAALAAFFPLEPVSAVVSGPQRDYIVSLEAEKNVNWPDGQIVYVKATSKWYRLTAGAWVQIQAGGTHFGGFSTPTAAACFTAIAGTDTTAMRSDGSPRLDSACLSTYYQRKDSELTALAALGLGSANQLWGMDAAGTAVEWKTPTLTSAGALAGVTTITASGLIQTTGGDIKSGGNVWLGTAPTGLLTSAGANILGISGTDLTIGGTVTSLTSTVSGAGPYRVKLNTVNMIDMTYPDGTFDMNVTIGGSSVGGTLRVNDNTAIGGAPNAAHAFYVTGSVTSGAEQNGIAVDITAVSNASTHIRGAYFKASPASGDAIAQANMVEAAVPTLAGGATITNLHMFHGNAATGATNNYGLYLEDVSGGTLNEAIHTDAGNIKFGVLSISSLVATDASGYLTSTISGLSPTFTGLTLSGLTASQAVFTDGSKGLVSNAITGSGNVMMSASPTTTGTLTGAAANFSGAVTNAATLRVGANAETFGTEVFITTGGIYSAYRYVNGPIHAFFHANGSFASRTATASGDVLGSLNFAGYQTTTGAYSAAVAQIICAAFEDFTNIAQGTRFLFRVTPTGSTSQVDRMVLTSTGLRIGSGTAPTVALDVTGAALISSTLTATGSIIGNSSTVATPAFNASSTTPNYAWRETDQGVDGKNWDIHASGGVWNFRVVNDAIDAARNIFVVTRSAATVATVVYGNSTDLPTHTFHGNSTFNQTLTSTGVLTASSTTDATSTTTGGSQHKGGLSVVKALWVGGLANIAGALTLQSTLGVTGVATFTANPRFNGGNTTGAGMALLGANSPAATLTAPYTWMTVTTSDGSTGYIPIWK